MSWSVGAGIGSFLGNVAGGLFGIRAGKRAAKKAWKRQLWYDRYGPGLKMQGLRSAGLNPILAYKGLGGIGTAAPMAKTHAVGEEAGERGMHSAYMAAQTRLVKEQAGLARAQADETRKRTGFKDIGRGPIRAIMDNRGQFDPWLRLDKKPKRRVPLDRYGKPAYRLRTTKRKRVRR